MAFDPISVTSSIVSANHLLHPSHREQMDEVMTLFKDCEEYILNLVQKESTGMEFIFLLIILVLLSTTSGRHCSEQRSDEKGI